MKKGINIILSAIASLVFLQSCQEILDKENLNSISPSIVYSDSTLATTTLSYVYYQNLPNWFGTSNTTSLGDAGQTDEAYSDNIYVQGAVTTTNVTEFGTSNSANNNYGLIRNINVFLRDIDNGPIPVATKNRMKAQSLFFRAWRYYELVKIYGGVPLVLTPLDAVGDDAKLAGMLPRNKSSECINQIVADLDTAAKYLPYKWAASTDWGRITKGACRALKGRVLLNYASPQFNPNDKTDYWQRAYDANKEVVDNATASGYALFSSYDQLWFTEVGNSEAVFVTGYNNVSSGTNAKNNTYDNATRPAYKGTKGGSNQPGWELVKAYPMKDGKKPGESTKYTYTDQLFYKNRDPRFDKTIAYNGCTWPLEGVSTYKLWTYYSGTATTEPGTATGSGFYLRKAVNTSVTAANAQYVGTDWIEIRYAEVLLNLAEAATGINKLDEAYTQLKAIRARAGIEAGTDGLYGLKANMTRAEMFDAILYERQIEFAFEGKRFWDLRRWRLMEKVLNQQVQKRNGIKITLKSNAPSNLATTRDGLVLDDLYTNYFTITPQVRDTKYALNWLPTYYFFPIPKGAMDNNPNLIQNSGWDSGTFDPLQ